MPETRLADTIENNLPTSDHVSSLAFSEKRTLLSILRSKELTAEQLQTLKKALELPELESFHTEQIPNSDKQGLIMELTEGNSVNAKQLLEKMFGNLRNPEKWDKKIFDKLSFVAIRNIKIPFLQQETAPADLHTEEYEQNLHHDGQLPEASYNFGLYHGQPQAGQTERQAPTMLSDAKDYHTQNTEFLLHWYIKNKDTQLPQKLAEVRDRIDYILNNPDKNPEFEDPQIGNNEMNEQNMKEWGVDPNSVEARLFQLSDTTYGLAEDNEVKNRLSAEFRQQFDDHVYHFKWTPNTLLMLNNKTLVHGRGPKPLDLRLAAHQLNEVGLTKTTIQEIIEKG